MYNGTRNHYKFPSIKFKEFAQNLKLQLIKTITQVNIIALYYKNVTHFIKFNLNLIDKSAIRTKKCSMLSLIFSLLAIYLVLLSFV